MWCSVRSDTFLEEPALSFSAIRETAALPWDLTTWEAHLSVIPLQTGNFPQENENITSSSLSKSRTTKTSRTLVIFFLLPTRCLLIKVNNQPSHANNLLHLVFVLDIIQMTCWGSNYLNYFECDTVHYGYKSSNEKTSRKYLVDGKDQSVESKITQTHRGCRVHKLKKIVQRTISRWYLVWWVSVTTETFRCQGQNWL